MDPQGQGRLTLRGITQGLMGGYDIPRPFSANAFIGRQQNQSQYSLQEPASKSSSRRRVDSNTAPPQRAERRDGTTNGAQRRLPEYDPKGELQTMRTEYSRLEEENRRYRTLLAALQSRQTPTGPEPVYVSTSSFGVTANLTSTGDVRRMMEELDAEVFQTAAALSEFDFQGKSGKNHPQASRRADSELHNRVVPILGGELVNLLSSGKSHPTPAILLQIALQTAMSSWSYAQLGAWVLARGDVQLEAFLADLYGDICRTEDSKDAARWRTITRKQLVKRASPSEMANSLLKHIVDVIMLTRYGSDDPVSRKTIEAAFCDRIEAVQRLVLDLNRDIGTRIVSDELEAVFVDPGATFDSRTMENMWPQDEVGKFRASEIVVCTTGLGLRKKVQNGAVATVFMKPKVLLRSTLGQLIT